MLPLEQNLLGGIPEFESVKRILPELAEKRLGPATINKTVFRARLRALGVVAQPAAIAVRAGLQNVYTHLEVWQADVPRCAQPVQGSPSGPLQILETREVRRPNGQIHIVAFMPHSNTIAPKLGETRNLLLQRLRHRTKQRDSYDFGEEGQLLAQILRCRPHIELAAQHHGILIFGFLEGWRLALLP